MRRIATFIGCALWLVCCRSPQASQLQYVSKQPARELLKACTEQLAPLGVICIQGKDWGAYARPSEDLSSSPKYQDVYRRARAYDHAGVQALALTTRPSGQFIFAFVDVFTQFHPYTSTPVTHADVDVQVYRDDSFFQSDDADAYVHTLMRRLPLLPRGSSEAKQYLAELDGAAAADRQKQQRRTEIDRTGTNPHCSMVVVNGVISPGSIYQLEQAVGSPDIEDTVARNPITCGGPGGCYGVAYLAGRRARIVDWDPNYYLLDVPIDFNIGRRNINAYARRSDAQCVAPSSPE